MRIMCVSTPQVKPTRVSPRPSARFGAGILPYVPHAGRKPYTAADERAAARLFADGPDDAEWDRLADESAFLDRYVSGRTWL
jgi:hypothetical protein